MIVKEYHINKNRVHDIWNDCECSQQKGNHFFKELRKVQSISLVLLQRIIHKIKKIIIQFQDLCEAP
jgi:hypothetical protein